MEHLGPGRFVQPPPVEASRWRSTSPPVPSPGRVAFGDLSARGEGEKGGEANSLRIFSFIWHVPALCMLARTGHQFEVANWTQRIDGQGWNLRQRPLPPNITLLDDEGEARARLAAGHYHLAIAQTPQDVRFLRECDLPVIFLAHTYLLVGAGGDPARASLQRGTVQQLLIERGGVFTAISANKLTSWDLGGAVLPVTVALDEWGGYHGSEPAVLTVGNLLVERDEVFDMALRARLVEDLPDRIVGWNPRLPQARPAESQAELLAAYQRHRVYLHITMEGQDDGYNMALFEAMATGMPVVSWAHPTSPIVDGYNGFISADEAYLRRCLRRLLDDPDLARRLGARARQTVAERFDVRYLVAACAEVFPWAIAGWRARPAGDTETRGREDRLSVPHRVSSSPRPPVGEVGQERGAVPGPQPEPQRLRIFAFNWHAPSLCMLARTGHHFEVPNWTLRLDGRGWPVQQRAVPPNVTLLEQEAEVQERLRAGAYDLMIAQTLHDVHLLADYGLPAIYLAHNRLLNEAGGEAEQSPLLRGIVCDFLAARGGVFCAISASKLASWGLDGHVLPVTVALDEWGGYHGSEPAVLTVGNLMREREHMFNTALRARLVNGLPQRVVGLNPGMPGAQPAASQAELLAAYQRHRVYLHVTMEEWEDGFNMSLLEAMATGMPVVCWANATSPIVDGDNGFISADEEHLRRCLRRLLDDDDLARRLGARARQTVAERFDVRYLVAACAEVFPQAIAGWRARRQPHPTPLLGTPQTPPEGAVPPLDSPGALVVRASVSPSLPFSGTERGPGGEVQPIPGPQPAAPRPKVVFAAQYYAPALGGAEHTAQTVMHELARRGYAVEAVCTGEPQRFVHNGVPVRVVPGPPELRQAVVESRPDVVITQLNFAPVAVQAAKDLGVPVLLSVMSYEHVCPVPLAMLTCDRQCARCPYWLPRADFMRAQRWAVEQADLVYCCSEHMARTIKEFYGRDAAVWYQPMDYGPDYVGPPDRAGRRYITMCTAMLLKGVQTFAEIARRMPEERFLVVGRGSPEAFGLDLHHNLTYWPDTKPRDFYAVTKVLLAPAIWPEPFGRTPLEAMANGIPVIASHVGGLPEAVGQAGILVRDYRNPDVWAEHLRSLLGNPALYEFYVARGREHCQAFALERLFPQLEALLARVLGRPAPPQVLGDAPNPARGGNAPSGLTQTAAAASAYGKDGLEGSPRADRAPIAEGSALPLSASERSPEATRPGEGPGGEVSPPPRVAWDGAQLVPHSLALVNRELELALLETGRVELALLPRGDDAAAMAADPRFAPLRERYNARLSGPVDVYVRHCWPPDFDPPPAGAWVVIQPWEYGAIPVAWLDPVERLIDEVWVPSNHVRQAFLASGVAPDRVVVVPNGVNLRVFRPDAPPRTLGTERHCKLLFVGGTVLQRKGVDVLLKAYRQAFTRADDICLVLKDLGSGWLYGGDVSRLLKPFQDDPDAPELLYLTDTLGDADMPGLYTACDALVHPFRGEGYGLPVAEALACGRPVVVTRGGACDDFCPDDATYWIPARRRTAGLEYEIAGEPWVLEPDVEALAAHLRAIYERPEEARARGRAGAAHAQQHLGWEHAARIALTRLEMLSVEGRRGRSPRRARAASGAAPVTPSFAVEAEAVEAFRAGREQANAGRWDEALRELNRALDLNPLLASAHYLLGYVELQRGRPAEALRALRQAVDLKADAADFQSALGVALHMTGDDAAAEAALRRALELDGARADVWANLGELCERQGRGADAAAAYERALALAPGDAGLAEALARVRAAAGSPAGDGLPLRPSERGPGGEVGRDEARGVQPASPAQAASAASPNSAEDGSDAWTSPPIPSPGRVAFGDLSACGEEERGGEVRPPAPRRRLNILVAGHHVPGYSSSLIVRALARAHDVLTVGPGWDEQTERGWLEAWREAPYIPSDTLPRYVARMRERARPADLPFERGVCNVGAMWARLPAGWRPDLFIWVDCYGTFLPAGTGNLPCPTVCLLGDTHVGLDPRIEYARNYRHVFLMFNRQHLPDFWAAGLPARWLPAACDPELHGAPPAAKRWDVGFAGQLHPRYYAERIGLLERLMGDGLDVRIDCGQLEDVARLFAASRIVFNRSLSQDLNMRVFEALAAGSLLLTNRLPAESGIELLFRSGEHLVVYDDSDQLVGLARWYIAHDAERERCARAGQAEVLTKHTYAHRADQMLAEVFGPAAADLARCAPEPVALPPYDDLPFCAAAGAQPRWSPLPALDLDALLTLAQEHVAAGAWDAAADALNRALDRDPLTAPAQYLLGCVELQRGRPAVALRALRQAADLAPDAADFQSALGVALHATGDDAAAEAALRRALDLDGGRADAWANLGELCEALGRWTEAAAAYDRALALTPGDGTLAEALARVRAAGEAAAKAV